MNHLYNRKGSAIIIAIIISLIATALTIFTIKISKNILYSSELLMDKLQAILLEESIVEKIKYYFSTERFYGNFAYFGNRRKFYLDGRTENLDNATLNLYDVGGLFNVWTPMYNSVERLLELKGVSSQTAFLIKQSLLDWYDKDNVERINGAEFFYYSSKGMNYTPRNSEAVQSIYEWKIIRGFNKNKAFDIIKPYLILCPRWRPNLNTMDRYMIASTLNISLEQADELIKERKKEGGLSTIDLKHIVGSNSSQMSNLIGFFPSGSVLIFVKSFYGNACSKGSVLISFHPTKKKPFYVIKWK